MKSYLFSEHERRVLKRFLKGDTTANNPTVMQVKSRMKSWTQLRQDVDLYLELARKFAESKAAMYT
jgi:hypothetical protein